MQAPAGQTTELDQGLPFTGLGAVALALNGLLFLLSGRALLLIGSKRRAHAIRAL